MVELEVKNHDQAHETRPFVGKGRVDLVKVRAGRSAGGHLSRFALVGTRDANRRNGKPPVRVHVLLHLGPDGGADGRRDEMEIGPGDVVVIPRGYDAWVVATNRASRSTSRYEDVGQELLAPWAQPANGQAIRRALMLDMLKHARGVV